MKASTFKDLASRIGCIICGNPFVELHHVRSGMGLGQRNNDFNILPLCHAHHRTGGYGVAFHAGKRTWQQNFGTELELLDKVKNIINKMG